MKHTHKKKRSKRKNGRKKKFQIYTKELKRMLIVNASGKKGDNQKANKKKVSTSAQSEVAENMRQCETKPAS